MKRLKLHLKKALIFVMGVSLFASCVKDREIDDYRTGGGSTGNGEITFTIEAPALAVAETKASIEQENSIKKLYVFAFNSTGLFRIFTPPASSLTATTTTTSEDTHSFTGSLPMGSYTFLAVANVDITGYTKGDSKATVESKIEEVADETKIAKWDVANRPIPMWGEVSKTIESTTTKVGIPVRRMLARVNVKIETGVTFVLEEVKFYNYNTKGLVKPFSDLTLPNLPSNPDPEKQTGHALTYSGSEVTATECKQQIYVFEHMQGIPYGTAGWVDNTCILIGGRYNGGAKTYYRLDFMKKGIPNEWLPILRNHSYNFKVTKILGDGFTDEADALKSAPINIENEVIVWDDNEMKEGSYDGVNELMVSGRKAHFNQFGVAEGESVFTVKSTLSSLTIGAFVTELVSGNKLDNDWRNEPLLSDTWTNDHFTVKFEPDGRDGAYYVHKVTVTAERAEDTDSSSRKSTFSVKGGGTQLVVNFEITQDKYIDYTLVVLPTVPFQLDGSAQFIDIIVYSTQDYTINFIQDATMMSGVSDYENGNASLPNHATGIDKSIQLIRIGVTASSAGTRIGAIKINHAIPASVNPREVILNVTQSSPAVTAALDGGGYVGNVPYTGQNVLINVNANTQWQATLKINGVDISGALSPQYLTAETGNTSSMVALKVGPNSGSTAKVFEVQFVSTSNPAIKSDVITITQAGLAGNMTSNVTGAPTHEGGQVTINVDSNRPWTITSITPSGAATAVPMSGSAGTGSAVIDVEENPGTTEREVVITFTLDDGKTHEVKITQPGLNPSLTAAFVAGTTTPLVQTGDEADIKVTSNVGWTATLISPPSGVSLNTAGSATATGTGNGTVKLIYGANTNANQRPIKVRFTSVVGSLTEDVDVMQSGLGNGLNVAVSSSTPITAAGGSITLDVTTDASDLKWKAVVVAPTSGASIPSATQTGSGPITLTLDPNDGTSAIPVKVEFRAEDGTVIKTLDTTQPGVLADLQTSVSGSPVSAIGGTATINVTSNVEWNVVSTSEGNLGTKVTTTGHNGSVTLTLGANTGFTEKTVTVVLSSVLGNKNVEVKQSPAAPTISVTEGNATIDKDGGNVTFTVSSNTTWTATANNGITPSISGNTVTVAVPENTGDQERIITVTFTTTYGTPAANASRTITQDAAPGPSGFILSPIGVATWAQANTACTNMGAGWSLPTASEIKTIMAEWITAGRPRTWNIHHDHCTSSAIQTPAANSLWFTKNDRGYSIFNVTTGAWTADGLMTMPNDTEWYTCVKPKQP